MGFVNKNHEMAIFSGINGFKYRKPPTGYLSDMRGLQGNAEAVYSPPDEQEISGEFKHSWGTAEKLYKSEVRSQDAGHAGCFGTQSLDEPGAFWIKKIHVAAI